MHFQFRFNKIRSLIPSCRVVFCVGCLMFVVVVQMIGLSFFLVPRLAILLKLKRFDAVAEKKLKRTMDQNRRLDCWRKRLKLFPAAVRSKATLKPVSEPNLMASVSRQLTVCHLTLKALTSNELGQESRESGFIKVTAAGRYRSVRCLITHAGAHPPFIWFNKLKIATASASDDLTLTGWVRAQ